jgi:hypothetical protein
VVRNRSGGTTDASRGRFPPFVSDGTGPRFLAQVTPESYARGRYYIHVKREAESRDAAIAWAHEAVAAAGGTVRRIIDPPPPGKLWSKKGALRGIGDWWAAVAPAA